MYHDASYYTLVAAQEDKLPASRHRRKQSLLEQPHNELIQADGGPTDGNVNTTVRTTKLHRPPEATVSRRAQSYSDFHYAVSTVLERDGTTQEGARSQDAEAKGEEVKNDLDFYDLYHVVEDDLLDATHKEYKAYRDQLSFSHSYLESLSLNTSSTLDVLTSLSNSFKAADVQTKAFQKQCESLTSEQKRIEGLADTISANLRYYSYLEPITKRLNAPGAGNFVKSREFSEVLTRLDECLEYMAAHSSQREAATYQSRYRLLMTRGLTLVRVHFVSAVREIASDVSRRIADRQLNDTTMSALLYAKFRVGASELKAVAREIRKRAVLPAGAEPGSEAEYQSLMNELYTSYSATRGKLVIPLIRKKIADIAMAPSTSKDLVSFARSSIGYVRGMCSDEFELWREWFVGDAGLYEFLESVCEPLYDHLRPRIIHEIQLLKLCELCTLLQTRYLRERDDDAEPVDDNRFDFTGLIQPALQDAQTRLVFRAQAILRDDIENYKSKSADIDYPAQNRRVSLSGTKSNGPVLSGQKTSKSESIPKPPEIVESDSPNGQWGLDAAASLQGWYPTLKKAIWLLSRIYRLVNSTVFDDLAHQIVHHTTLSLHRAADQIISKATVIDGQLFLLKHLLILKQQIVAFDFEYVTPDVSFDFSGVTNTFWELRERGGLFDPRNLWRFMGGGLLPRVVENMLDAKVELDGRLRTVINNFTNGFASRMTSVVDGNATAQRGFDNNKAVIRIQELVEKEVPLLRRKLSEYLDDTRTKETLVGAVQDQVVQNYETFYDLRVADRRGNGVPSNKKGKSKEDGLWDPDSFASWAAGVFLVSSLGFGQQIQGSSEGSRSRSISRTGST